MNGLAGSVNPMRLIEVDFEFTLAIPAIFLWELATATDPDEPD